MSNRTFSWLFGLTLVVALTGFTILQFAHKLENQNLAIVQSMDGDVIVRREAGWWIQICPTITEYPKAGIYICSKESPEHDPFVIEFKNKSTAIVNAQVGYRIDTAADEKIIALHQAAEGNDEKIWQLVVNTINTEAQKVSTTFDPSDVIGGDKFQEFVAALQKAIIHNKELLESGIDVDKFNVSGKPIPDDATRKQFDKQREADLAKRLAASVVQQLEAETEKERAEAARKTEHEKIEAQALMAKEKLDFERQKQNETIAAEKKLALAKIAKEEAEVKAQQEAEVAKINANREKQVAEVEAEKLFKVAEVQKKTEKEVLETIKLKAEQKVAEAQAKKEAITLAGEITEAERIKLEIDKETKIGVAKAYAEGIGKLKLPTIMTTGNSTSNGPSDAMKTFFDLKNAAIALEMSEQIMKPENNAK